MGIQLLGKTEWICIGIQILGQTEWISIGNSNSRSNRMDLYKNPKYRSKCDYEKTLNLWIKKVILPQCETLVLLYIAFYLRTREKTKQGIIQGF